MSGAAGLDSQYSLDGATFTACTNEATEIATSSGIYYLDLLAAELNSAGTAVIVKSSTTGAITKELIFYPSDGEDIGVNVTLIRDSNAAIIQQTLMSTESWRLSIPVPIRRH
jgi:hypothetical protein